jgi:ABC-type spermidine/putrescine transport system permease subunit II
MITTPAERFVHVLTLALAGLALFVLYAPVFVGALFSMVEVTRQGVYWESATLAWYARLWTNADIVAALRATLVVGLTAVAIAVVLSIVLALYVNWEGALGRGLIELLVYLPFLLPPIITGLSLLVFFSRLGVERGIATLAVGHAAFVLALVYRIVLTRLRSIPRSLVEASADLGASRWQTFVLVLWPQLRPAVVTGAVLGFALSFDETLISVFLSGSESTLPLRLWAMMRVGFTPEINALVTLVLAATIVLAVIVSLRMRPADGGQE